jgi:hypothetical protein
MYWPEFENPFLMEISDNLRKRHKALKHKTSEIKCERIVEIEDGQRTEKIELEFRPSIDGCKVCVRAFAWSDRWMWIDARSATKQGWAWEWNYEGRLLGEYGGREVVGSIEVILSKVYNIEPRRTGELTNVWTRLLAQGPKRFQPHK